ncbi:NupX-like nucleoside:proton symporter [Candidatus Cyrtobacter comes]|uniref:NupX-like nucleoside:proton symporter n=1 Tax=Candidatus Cyrtobacter comes TaxID=675776 RepID=A0ABU5L7E1_9RICK|nr:nucleoside transporter C-terminal domain-containing protein [Candidatus Cyrtobacter comes]MDZ5762041.1 NupX-like nucleoside:proton symporter [Candidatus Cyrtobacter comes]
MWYLNIIEYLRFILATGVFCSIAWLLSENKGNISIKLIIRGILVQIFLALLMLKVEFMANALIAANNGLQVIVRSTNKAVSFCFGGLANPPKELGFIFALQGLPMLITVSAISALLMHWRILPFIINTISKFFRYTMKIGGTLGVGVSTNIFTGLSETPLIMKHYLDKLTRSELLSLMMCGAAGVSGTVMLVYSEIISPLIEAPLHHIISSAAIGVPTSLIISRMIIPESSSQLTEGGDINTKYKYHSNIDALYTGIMDGAKVIAVVIPVLMGFIAVIDVANSILGNVQIGNEPLSLQMILGFLCAPLAWLVGIPWQEATTVGSLIGIKTIMNEIIGFQELVNVSGQLSQKSTLISIYAICGFANIASTGTLVGLYGILIPEKIKDVAKMAPIAIIGGMISNLMTASVISMII